MRSAHLQALDKLEPGKGTTFKRFEERVRTHLFDLDRIGGVTSPDLIRKLSKKLIPQDLLEWNSGGPRFTGRPDEHTLNDFGNWLCARADAYQKAYDIAAEQAGGSRDGQGRGPLPILFYEIKISKKQV